jgi:dTDP-4-dehydrorhamnose reductase
MRILITGKTGQVGYELERSMQGLGQIIAVDRAQMDLADLDQVRAVIQSVKPDLLVNAAAYTAVDKAESEPQLVVRINAEAPAVMAEELKRLGGSMIHYSTDYVFDGTKTSPYTEQDSPSPINTYGSSKLAGEQAIEAAGIPHLILRTSWIYGMRGKNFLLTILRLAKERDELRIVSDQHGAPTWCRTIADATAHAVAQSIGSKNRQDWWRERSGIYHVTAQGRTTWHGFAEAILNHPDIPDKPAVIPIASASYPTPARRPLNSEMNCERWLSTFCGLPDWDEALTLCRT